MDNENEKNKNESLEREKSPEAEINLEVLTATATEKKETIKRDYESSQETIKDLAKKAVDFSAGKEDIGSIKDEVNNLEAVAKELKTNTENKIDQEIAEPSLDHLPNYKSETPEAKLAEIIPASRKIQERFDTKISPEMKEAIATVCGQVFNKGKYPYALIGSNCYIPHTEHSEKIPDDLDVIFGIKDLGIDLQDIIEEKNEAGETTTKVAKYEDGAYSDLLKLQEQGLIKDLSVKELRKFGKEKNGCVKIHCFVKTSNGWKEMEAFAQNMQDEIANQGKSKNGIINLGAEEQRLEVIDVNGIKANIGSEKTAEELYLKNTVHEFALYNLNGWENKGFLNAKALQRIFNIINLDGQNFEDSIDQMIENIGKIDPPTEESRVAQASLTDLWNKFKSLPEKGNGLVNHLIEKDKTKIDIADPKERKIIATEKAVDIITTETKRDMELMSNNYDSLAKICQETLDNPESSPQKIKETIAAIDQEIKSLSAIGAQYKEYLKNVNSADKNDFCVYAAMPQLRNQFIQPLMLRLAKNRKNLKEKLNQ